MSHASFQLSGTAPEIYETHFVPTLLAPISRLLLERGGVLPGDRVLDVACGTGIVARGAHALAGPTGSITGVDLNPGMLEVARSVTRLMYPAIQLVQANALELPFEAAAFDVVFCGHSLMFFPDRAKALREMHRVTVPHGRLVASTWRAVHHNPAHAAFAESARRHVGPAADMLLGIFALADTEQLRGLLAGEGWREVRVEIATVPTRYPSAAAFVDLTLAGLPASELSARLTEHKQKLADDLTLALKEYVDDFGIVFPTNHLIAFASRSG